MTSSVVRVLPESYSSVIPSLAISAALSWDDLAAKTLFEDWYLDQKFEVSIEILFLASCKRSLARSFFMEDFFIEDIFSFNYIFQFYNGNYFANVFF